MLSIETETKVAKLLSALSSGEQSVELTRKVLFDNYDFDSYQVFKELDIEGKGKVDSYNISNFLKRRGIFATLSDIQFILRFYDTDCDGSLSYNEFLNFVQSSNTFKRSSRFPSEKMPYNVEYSFGKVIEKELELTRRLSVLIGEVKYRYDFNMHDVFHLLNKCTNVITAESLKVFMSRNNMSHLECEIRSIMKRLDVNRDGRVDLIELSAFFGCPMCTCGTCSCCCCDCCQRCTGDRLLRSSSSGLLSSSLIVPEYPVIRSQSKERKSGREELKDNKAYNDYNNKGVGSTMTTGFKSTIQTRSPEPDVIMDYNSSNAYDTKYGTGFNKAINAYGDSNTNLNQSIEYKQVSPNLLLRASPERKFSPKRTMIKASPRNNDAHANNNNNNSLRKSNRLRSSLKTKKPSILAEEDKLIDYLSTVMNEELNIETLKTDLSLRTDFNVEDAFRLFELNDRDYLTADDLKYGLSLLDIFATDQDAKILMKHFDLQGKGIMTYSDFFDMIVPYEANYRSIVEKRQPNSCCSCKSIEAFTQSTKTYFQTLMRSIIAMENQCNTLKGGLTSVRSSLKAIFPAMDVMNKGYLTEEDLERYLKKRKAYTSTRACNLLFIHLDKNRNGEVEYWEIDDALMPL